MVLSMPQPGTPAPGAGQLASGESAAGSPVAGLSRGYRRCMTPLSGYAAIRALCGAALAGGLLTACGSSVPASLAEPRSRTTTPTVTSAATLSAPPRTAPPSVTDAATVSSPSPSAPPASSSSARATPRPSSPVSTPTPTRTAAPAPSFVNDCVIKGNISSSGERIYHVPGQQNYDDTVITVSKGERWFCTEAEALAAGWRRAKR